MTQSQMQILYTHLFHKDGSPEELDNLASNWCNMALTGFACCFWDWDGPTDENGAPYIEAVCFSSDNDMEGFYIRWHGVPGLEDNYWDNEPSIFRLPTLNKAKSKWKRAMNNLECELKKHIAMSADEFDGTGLQAYYY